MRDWLQTQWWQAAPPPLWLRPLAALYGVIADARSRRHAARAQRLPVPVVVVGNIAVGGSGKTPVVLALMDALRACGRTPGVLARGYGGSGPFPLMVTAATLPGVCGDEPALIARRTGAPVCVAPDRVAAGRSLLAAHPAVDVLVCDDGLQHRALHRDLELCVIDGVRGHGNGWRLPAGPLREPPARAARCALQVVNGGRARDYAPDALGFDLHPGDAVHLRDGQHRPLAQFQRVHAVAGIGNPARFFASLRAAGVDVQEHPFPDHHRFTARDLAFGDDLPVLMTEKDAVKCAPFADARCWMLPVQLRWHGDAAARLHAALDTLDAQPALRA